MIVLFINEDAKDLSEVALEKFVNLDAAIVRVSFKGTIEITEDFFKGIDLKNKAVLIHTGWDVHYHTEAYFENNPYLTKGAAEYLSKYVLTWQV